MHLDDPVLPAARELAGPAAQDVLRPTVVAAGGTLHAARCAQVHYVPGRELVARYDCDITWPTGRRRDTLLAATTSSGHLPDTVAVTADTPTVTLEVCVWRWPFDPILSGLPIATTPAVLAKHLGPVVVGAVRSEVVAYRPTERAVVRVTDAAGHVFYLKVLPPVEVSAIAERHEVLRRAGVCAPEVIHADHINGLLLLEAMPGETLRDRIKSRHDAWIDPEALTSLLQKLDSSDVAAASGPARASRTRDAIAHVRLLGSVFPEGVDTLEALGSQFEDALETVEQRSGPIVHGDLHESQLLVDDTGAITGVIDLDDLGAGDPVDDPAVLLGHLEYRALNSDEATAAVLRARIAELREHFEPIHGAAPLDLAVAAVLVGLATGPFRAQVPEWRQLTGAVVTAATRHAAASTARTPNAIYSEAVREVSSPAQARLTAGTDH